MSNKPFVPRSGENVFQARKGVHIVLERQLHAALRAKLFPMGLSLTQVFEEFARRFVIDDTRATRIVDTLIERRMKEALDGHKPGKRPVNLGTPGELDADVLYKMIDESLEEEHDETDR